MFGHVHARETSVNEVGSGSASVTRGDEYRKQEKSK